MNREKIIGFLMMKTIEEVSKARDRLQKFIEDLNLKEDDKYWELVDVCLQNIDYYARMIIED